MTFPGIEAAHAYHAEVGGRSLLIGEGGDTVFERYDNDGSVDTPTHLHSATKSFFGVVAAAMVDDGLLPSFDVLVGDVVGEWQSDEVKRTITLRQLLNLSSGLGEDIPALQGPSRPTHAPDKYSFAVGLPIVTAPGEKFRYGPSHFYALGEVFKRVLAPRGQDPLAYLEERVLDPIGCTYDRWVRDGVGNPHIPNGAWLTGREWAKFAVLLVGAGKQPVDAALMAALFEPSAANPGYGLTFWLNRPGGSFVDGAGPTGERRSRRPAAPEGSPGGFLWPAGAPDLAQAAGALHNFIAVFPSRNSWIVRQSAAQPDTFDDRQFIGLLHGNVDRAGTGER